MQLLIKFVSKRAAILRKVTLVLRHSEALIPSSAPGLCGLKSAIDGLWT